MQLSASLDGILKMPNVVGVKIDQMDKPSDWTKPFPIRLGMILDEKKEIKLNGETPIQNKPYLKLISHSFQLRKDSLISDVAQQNRRVIELLTEYGLSCANCFLNQFDTVESGATLHGMSPAEIDQMVSEINGLLESEKV